jgi:hypothetical protein
MKLFFIFISYGLHGHLVHFVDRRPLSTRINRMRSIIITFTVMVWSLVLFSCAGEGVSRQGDLLSQSVIDEIIAHGFGTEDNRNIEIEVTGESTILPYEQERGIDQGVCLKIRYEEKISADQWAAGTSSRVVQRAGDEWIVDNALLWVERAWYQHSCPGTYESIVPK